MSSNKVELSMQEISRRIASAELPEFDIVVGIATGGLVPASLIAYKTLRPLRILKLNYRDEQNNPVSEEPRLLSDLPDDLRNKIILLVDDVSVSGKTFEKAKSLLEGNEIITFVMKGKGDYVMFPEVSTCVKWPWKTE
jgi:uncharacterized protein